MAEPEIRDWLAALEHRGLKVERDGAGWKAQCPAHEDRNPSLSLDEGDQRSVVANCFAGCTFEDIRAALGLREGDPPPPTPIRPRAPAPPPEPKIPQALPSGRNVTAYHYVTPEGEAAFTVIRRDVIAEDGSREKRISQWTPAENGLWISQGPPRSDRPLYRLPEVLRTTGQIVVVEGEKCVEAVARAWPGQPVTTWAGGTETWRFTDWTPLAGRPVTVVADGDEPNKRGEIVGHKVAVGIAGLLHGLGSQVSIVLPEPGSGDIADWLEEDKQEAANLIRNLRRAWPLEGREVTVSADAAELRTNQHYQLLGLRGDEVAIRIAAGRVLYKTREALTVPSTLIAIAPLSWWVGLSEGPLMSSQARILGDALIREADRIGQIDLQTIAGRGAVRMPDGVVVYHLGDRLCIAGEEAPLEYGHHIWLAEARVDLPPPAAPGQMREIAQSVLQYRWASTLDGRRLMGWIVAAIVGGALEWRPHVLFTAPAGEGKSWIIRDVLQRLMGPLLLRIADASPAGIARLTAMSSLPLTVDEAEPSNPWVLDLLAQLRIASGAEGLRIRADTASGGVVMQMPRFSAMLSSTSTPALSRADATRLTPVRLGPPVADWPKVRSAIRRAMQHADNARGLIIRRAPQIVGAADTLSRELQDRGWDTRDAMATAALTAGWRAWGVDDELVRAGVGASHLSDAGEALLEILSIRHRVTDRGPVEKSVLQWLAEAQHLSDIADLYGIKRDGDDLHIAPQHRGLARALSRSRWAGVDIARLLLQITDATATNPLRFGSLRARAVHLPHGTLQTLGVDWGDVI